jgi:hypothetical protein
MDTMGSSTAYQGGEGVRFDADGNKIHDPSVANYSGTGYADSASSRGDGMSRSPGEKSDQWNRTEHRQMTNDQWNSHWNGHDMTAINESELPSAARAGLLRGADGSSLSEVKRGTWDGKPAYCAKVMKNGSWYHVATDADGTVLASRPIN